MFSPSIASAAFRSAPPSSAVRRTSSCTPSRLYALRTATGGGVLKKGGTLGLNVLANNVADSPEGRRQRSQRISEIRSTPGQVQPRLRGNLRGVRVT